MCALEAKKNSRDAEIHADRAGIELMRLYGLLGDAGLDDETVQAFRRLVRKLTTGGKPEGF
jgi:predicted Zn-dependent protease